jgi:hypothetical protein
MSGHHMKKVDALSAFRLRCDARAVLVAEGLLDLQTAVDELQASAVASGSRPRRCAEHHVGRLRQEDPGMSASHCAAQSTCDALLYELRTHGVERLAEPNCRQRLAELSTDQVRELIAALLRIRSKHPAITDELLLQLGGQL